MIYDLATPDYARSNFDRETAKLFGDYSINDALTKEVMLVAYSYNV
jgi:hypothetical protein